MYRFSYLYENEFVWRYGGPRFGRAIGKTSDDDRWDTVTFSDMILLAGDTEAENNDYNESRWSVGGWITSASRGVTTDYCLWEVQILIFMWCRVTYLVKNEAKNEDNKVLMICHFIHNSSGSGPMPARVSKISHNSWHLHQSLSLSLNIVPVSQKDTCYE